MSETASVDFKEISDVASDYKLLQARNSKDFVQLMVDICAAVNACPMGKLKNIDIDELKSQTGYLLYFAIKGLDDPIPCDIEFVPQLHSHFRKPTILVLRRIQKHLITGQRRILGRMEREQAMERIVNMGEFDVSAKIRAALDEMNRIEKMAGMVRGGGRKLDILTQALHVPSRARFELITIDRIIRDPHHLRHREAMKWLDNSKFKGNAQAIHGLIKNGFQMLDSAANKILDLMEELAGVSFPRDASAIDLQRNWYSLGNALPRGEEFIKSFTAEEEIQQKIKRLTWPMVRVGWDVERMRARRDRVLVDINIAKIQVTQLSNLIFDIEKKITTSTKPDGEVNQAIVTDFDNGMLSIREREEAEAWVRDNKIKLQELIIEVYDNLKELKEANPKLALPGELEKTIEGIKSGMAGDKESQKTETENEFGKITIDDIAKKVTEIEARLESPDGAVISELVELRAELIKRINQISIKNIDFHKRVRDAFPDFGDYENKVLELYKMEEQMEQMRVNVEGWLIDCYRIVSYEDLPDKILNNCMEIVTHRMLLGIRKLDFSSIDATNLGNYLDEAMKLEGKNQLLHLDQLLQEILAIPQSEQLLEMLKDWEKDLGKDKVKEHEAFVLENSDKLQELTDKVRSELREQINDCGGKGLTRRLRFEVFGLADCLAESLGTLLHALMSTADRLANDTEGDLLVRNLQSLEAQVIEAQKSTKPNGEAYERLKNLADKEHIGDDLVKEMKNDLKVNFKNLDRMLNEVSAALKEVKNIQNKFGGDKDTDYLDVTLNINDIERLKDVYDFVEGITMEDTKRFCVSYNLKAGLISNLFERVKKKDPTVPKEISGLINRKTTKMFQEKRFIPLPLKTAIFKNSKEIFEAECQLLCHTLNLVNPLKIRKKASYISIMTLFGQAKNADHQIIKMLGLMWGRIQTRLFKFKPSSHEKNFEGNRQAMMTDVKDQYGEIFKR